MSVGTRLAIASGGFRGGGSDSGASSTTYYTSDSANMYIEPSDNISVVDSPTITISQADNDDNISIVDDDINVAGIEVGESISLI
jgi:hypothetical protein